MLTGCAGAVPVSTPPDPPRQCRALIERLPDTVADVRRRAVEPAGAAAAAWGDPPIVLRCGVPRPAGLRPTSRCDLVNGVGWFSEEIERGWRFTTIGRQPYVEVVVPYTYEAAGGVLARVAGAVKGAIARHRRCV